MLKSYTSVRWPKPLAIKLAGLADILRQMGSVLVAFSGGVDSTFLCLMAHQVLGRQARGAGPASRAEMVNVDSATGSSSKTAPNSSQIERVLLKHEKCVVLPIAGCRQNHIREIAPTPDRLLAVTADSPSLPRRELEDARTLAKLIGIPHQIIASGEMANPRFRRNPANRCYLCKKERLTALLKIARDKGLATVVDGSNVDDTGDFRPGSRAVRELGVRSPLQEAGFSKKDIREASRRLGLPTADKPSMACLVTRLPHDARITEASLQAVEKAEEALQDLGFRVCRVRVHGDVARVELDPAGIARAAAPRLRGRLVQALQACGFRYVALDLAGYRTGSMNPGVDHPGE